MCVTAIAAADYTSSSAFAARYSSAVVNGRLTDPGHTSMSNSAATSVAGSHTGLWGNGAGVAQDAFGAGTGPWIGGWGDTVANDGSNGCTGCPSHMYEAEVPIVDDTTCGTNLVDPTSGVHAFDATSELCA